MRCIDIRLKNVQQLFDNRDPAPFYERDLDQNAVEYIVGAVEELPAKTQFKLVLLLAEVAELETSEAAVVQALRRHFDGARARAERNIRKGLREGRWLLLIGLVALTAFLTLAELTAGLREVPFAHAVPEGLVIIGWVTMWRPLEGLLYDWWPLAQERRMMQRIASAVVEVRRL